MAQKNFMDEDLADLIQRVEDAAIAYINGDMDAYLTLIKHANDYTLMQPFGGAVTGGYDASAERVESTARFFQGGEAKLELVQSYTSGDLAVLVAIERQHGKVGGLPDQNWSLRVTLVFRRVGSEWQMAHRHADTLVHGLSLEQVAASARG